MQYIYIYIDIGRLETGRATHFFGGEGGGCSIYIY